MSFWPVVKKVIKESDLVVEVLDSRLPEVSINKELERMVKYHNKLLFRVFTKIDLVSQQRARELEKLYPEALFVSGTKNLGVSKLKRILLVRAHQNKITNPSVGFVGYPNMGKSAIINALAKRGRAKVSSVAGTTKGIQWVNAGELRILDSPGVVPFEDGEVTLGMLGAKNPEKLRNLDRVVFALLKRFIHVRKESLEKSYNIEIKEGMDEYEVLLEIGKSRKYLLKGGIVDENRTMYTIMRDWQAGKLIF